MTTLQSLQASRLSSQRLSFCEYAKQQVSALYKESDKEEVKKEFARMKKDTKDFTLYVTDKVDKEEKRPFSVFGSVVVSIDEKGHKTKKQLYAIEDAPETFADVDKVISYYCDNYAAKLAASLAFIAEQKRKEADKVARAKAKEEKEDATALARTAKLLGFASVAEMKAALAK